MIYSPKDLSCYWNQAERSPDNTAVILATKVGQNVIDYATGKELPADKLVVREVHDFRADPAKRGALRIAKLRHAGEWNVAPLAVPNLMDALRRPPLSFDVVINHKELFPRDPNLIYYPLVYLHGRAAFSFPTEDLEALRRHLEPGGGTLFADAACGSPAFDAAFRRFAAELLPGSPLVPIPRDDEFYSTKVGFDLSDCQYTKAAGGGKDFPQLEGVKLNGHWAVIYSKSTSAAPWSGTPGWTARDTLTSRPSRSPPTSSSTPHCREPDSGRTSLPLRDLADPGDVPRRVELLPRALVAHEPDRAEDRPLGPGAIVLAADRPGHAGVAVGVASVHLVAVVEIQRDLERRPRRPGVHSRIFLAQYIRR